jgi:hypothetical protein
MMNFNFQCVLWFIAVLTCNVTTCLATLSDVNVNTVPHFCYILKLMLVFPAYAASHYTVGRNLRTTVTDKLKENHNKLRPVPSKDCHERDADTE